MIFLLLFLVFAPAQSFAAFDAYVNLAQTASSAGEIVRSIYLFSLMIGGLLAFGAIVYGAIRYASSGGNSTAQTDARTQITNALVGLLLLAGAALILQTINPNLTNLNIFDLSEFGIGQSTSSGACPVTGMTDPHYKLINGECVEVPGCGTTSQVTQRTCSSGQNITN